MQAGSQASKHRAGVPATTHVTIADDSTVMSYVHVPPRFSTCAAAAVWRQQAGHNDVHRGIVQRQPRGTAAHYYRLRNTTPASLPSRRWSTARTLGGTNWMLMAPYQWGFAHSTIKTHRPEGMCMLRGHVQAKPHCMYDSTSAPHPAGRHLKDLGAPHGTVIDAAAQLRTCCAAGCCTAGLPVQKASVLAACTAARAAARLASCWGVAAAAA